MLSFIAGALNLAIVICASIAFLALWGDENNTAKPFGVTAVLLLAVRLLIGD